MKILFIITGLLILSFSGCSSVELALDPCHCTVLEKTFKTGQPKNPNLDYDLLVFKPKAPDEKFPLIVVFHGVGQSGSDYLLKYWQDDAARRRFMILSVDWKKAYRNDPVALKEIYSLLDEITQKYSVEKNKVAIAGVSAGGLLARWLVEGEPQRWKAAVLLAYATSEDWTQHAQLKDFPPFLFVHGTKDEQFSSNLTAKTVENLRQKGFRVDWIEDAEAGHEHRPEWNGKIFDWIEKQSHS